MSTHARDAYFNLARALTRASFASALNVPKFPDDALEISDKKVDRYRVALQEGEEKRVLDDVENWSFGGPKVDTEDPIRRNAFAFADYVFLQRFSSDLRTKLSLDLRSRRRPA